MDENGLFIPPCCVETKLPKAVMQAPRRSLSFYTHGDVTFEKFYSSVSYLVADPHVLVLSMPILTFATASYLAQCFERGWITDLIISTAKDITPLVEKYLTPYMSHILHMSAGNVSQFSAHMVLYTDKQSLSISGPMVESRMQGVSLVAYTLLYSPRFESTTSQMWANTLLNILHPDILRARQTKPNTLNLSNNLVRFLHLDMPPYKDEK